MKNHQPPYLSYLLRLWPTRNGTQCAWRLSLEDPHSGERQGFASFHEMLAYLEDQTREYGLASGPQPGNEVQGAGRVRRKQ